MSSFKVEVVESVEGFDRTNALCWCDCVALLGREDMASRGAIAENCLSCLERFARSLLPTSQVNCCTCFK